MRIRSVNLRYHGFRNEIDLLHDLQKVPIAERHEFEEETLKRERHNALGVLAMKCDAEIRELQAVSASKINGAERQFQAEYQSRLEAEQRIEDTYVSDMAAFWNGKPECEEKVRNARNALRQNQSQHYEFWHLYQQQKLQAVAEEENHKLEVLKEKHSLDLQAIENRARGEEAVWKRKRWAERRWIDDIVLERTTMLQELEQDEYTRGEEVF